MTSPKMTHPALYRVNQFMAALKASLPPWVGGTRKGLTADDESLVTSILKTTPQQQLFTRMSPHDRRHAIAVARTLHQAGHRNPALLQAALLHDVAKSMGQPIIHRVLIVLLDVFWPEGLRWLSTTGESVSRQITGHRSSRFAVIHHSPIPWWRRPFVIHAQHPAIGAAWAAQAACEPLAVRLIARHQEELEGEPVGEEEKLLAALQRADDLN